MLLHIIIGDKPLNSSTYSPKGITGIYCFEKLPIFSESCPSFSSLPSVVPPPPYRVPHRFRSFWCLLLSTHASVARHHRYWPMDHAIMSDCLWIHAAFEQLQLFSLDTLILIYSDLHIQPLVSLILFVDLRHCCHTPRPLWSPTTFTPNGSSF